MLTDEKEKLRRNISINAAREEKYRDMAKDRSVKTWAATHKPYSMERIGKK